MNSLELNKETELTPKENTVEVDAALEQPTVENENVTETADETQQKEVNPTETVDEAEQEEVNPTELADETQQEEVNPTETADETSPEEVKEVVHPPEKEQVQVQEEKTETSVSAVEEKKNYGALERAELIELLKALIDKEVKEVKDDVEQIKQWFYKKLKAEIEEQKKLFVESGGEEADFKSIKDELEEVLKSLLADFKAKKAALSARIEQEKENNLLQKQHILKQMKALTETTNDVSSCIGEFKDLQQKWKTIGAVPSAHTTDLWKQYNQLQEKFWDLIKINNELREYDFKKNLELKIALCEAAERLRKEKNIVTAARQIQKLHEEWREIGPVARDIREKIWHRFKEITSEINRKHQTHFTDLRQGEEENLNAKIALCEKLEAFDTSELKSYNAWDRAAEEIKKMQEEWRAIGFAPRKENQALFDRYRKACNEFFDKKTAYYKDAKSEMTENLEKKKALCEQAEALKDSIDWKEASEQLMKLQRQWKEIGHVQKKHSDEIWKRFIAACDYFFEQKNKNVSGQRSEEHGNLKAKQEIITKITNIDVSEPTKAHAILKELIEEFRKIGHVPFREKDKIHKAYRKAVDKLFDALNIDESNRRLESFKGNLDDMINKGEKKVYREREKMFRAYERLKSEIATYENNFGFFTSTSKKANSMLKEMERKIESLKEEAKLIEQKIRLIDDKL